MVQLQSGYGMHGGPENPLGARALYLGRAGSTRSIAFTAHNGLNNGHDSFSAGCIRMRNEDVIDTYEHTDDRIESDRARQRAG